MPPPLPASKCLSPSATVRWIKQLNPRISETRKQLSTPQNQPCSAGSGQQCCSQAPQQVCRQVPRRIPVWRYSHSSTDFQLFIVLRNVTVPNVSWKEECRTVNQTLPPRQKTIYVEQNVTKSQRICNKVYKEETFNYTMPKYEVIKTNRSEKVGQGGVSFKRLRSAKDEVGLKKHHFRFHLWCRSASFGRRRKSTITHSPMQVRTSDVCHA